MSGWGLARSLPFDAEEDHEKVREFCLAGAWPDRYRLTPPLATLARACGGWRVRRTGSGWVGGWGGVERCVCAREDTCVCGGARRLDLHNPPPPPLPTPNVALLFSVAFSPYFLSPSPTVFCPLLPLFSPAPTVSCQILHLFSSPSPLFSAPFSPFFHLLLLFSAIFFAGFLHLLPCFLAPLTPVFCHLERDSRPTLPPYYFFLALCLCLCRCLPRSLASSLSLSPATYSPATCSADTCSSFLARSLAPTFLPPTLFPAHIPPSRPLTTPLTISL